MPDVTPDPKSRSLDRPSKRYRRKVASRKQWEAIVVAKQGPCRICVDYNRNGHDLGVIEFHHVVARAHGGDDIEDNIVPVHAHCHMRLTLREASAAIDLLCRLSDAEYAYMVQRGGEDYAERAYGLRYSR